MPTKVSLPGYVTAVLRARARLLSLDVDAVRQLEQTTRAYADELERALSRLARDNYDGQRFLRAAVQANRRLSIDLHRALLRITDKQVELSYGEVSRLLQKAAAEAMGTSLALRYGITAVAPADAAAAYLARRGVAAGFRTLTTQAVALGTQEVDRIIASAIGTGTDPLTLARRLRKYVVGSETLQDLERDGVIRLTDIPKSMQGAGRVMEFNARRIALTEMGNAAHEAELRQFSLTPHVRAVRWMLSPNRGKVDVPDVCDVLAKTDHYGMGEGVYPVQKVPAKPHPFDRCWLLPVMATSVGELDKRKPNPKEVLDPGHSPVLDQVNDVWARRRLKAEARNKVRAFVGPGGVPKSELGIEPKPRPVPPPALPEPKPVPFVEPKKLEPLEYLAAPRGQTPGFTPARKISEAMNFARVELGVPLSEYKNLEAANTLNEGLYRLKRLGLKMPNRVKTSTSTRFYGQFSYPSDTITVSTYETAAARAASFESGWLTTDHGLSTVYHEFGHHHDWLARNKVGLDRARIPATIKARLDAAGLIGKPKLGGMSTYGMSQVCEYIAETIGGVMSGTKFNPLVLEIYFELGGPEIPGVLERAKILASA